MREVLEETGYTARILRYAGEARWSYQRGDVVFDEVVSYYFMTRVGRSRGAMDGEFDRVAWVKTTKAPEMLSYPSERALLASLLSDPLLWPS